MLHEFSGIKPIKPLNGDTIPEKDFTMVIFLGTSNIQCKELIYNFVNKGLELNVFSYNKIEIKKIKYNYFNMDVNVFLKDLYEKLKDNNGY